MFLIRKTALEILTKLYPNFSKRLCIEKPDFNQILNLSDDDILKCLCYLANSQYLIIEGSYKNDYHNITKIEITAKGIDWVEDNITVHNNEQQQFHN